MAGLYDALIGNYNPQDYLSEDPFYMSGARLAQTQLPKPTSNAQAIFGPLLQNLAAGTMMGYGKQSAYQSAFDDVRQSPLMASLTSNIGPVANPDQYANMLEYSGDVMPNDWTPKRAQGDLILAAIQKQAADEEKLKKLEAQEKLVNTLAQKNLMLSDGKIVAMPGAAEAVAGLTKAEELAKVEAQGQKPKEIPTSLINELADQKSLADGARALATQLEESKMSWAELRLAKNFSVLDKDGKALAMEDLADRLLRTRTGAAAPVAEKKSLQKIATGDWTVGPQQAAALLRKFADREEASARSQLEVAGTTKSLEDAVKLFNIPIAKPNPKSFSSGEAYSAAMDAWRAAGGK